jgi:hypothetical protein
MEPVRVPEAERVEVTVWLAVAELQPESELEAEREPMGETVGILDTPGVCSA